MARFWSQVGLHLCSGEQGELGGVQSKEGRLDYKNMTFHDIEIFVYMTEVGTVAEGKGDRRCRTYPHISPHLNYFGSATRQGPERFRAASGMYPYISRHRASHI